MWDEDPRYQNAVCRFLIGSVVALTLIATVASILERDWEFLRHWFLGLGVVLAALCLYVAIVWLVVHIVRLVAQLMRKVFHGGRHDV
jgi:ABC-type arginine/histidine transport system permease subunit